MAAVKKKAETIRADERVDTMMWIAVALGGALGSVARHWVNLEMAHRLERSVPLATFVVNVVAVWLGFYLGL